ncbi:MAG: APC family permease [Sedimentibacter sp.]|uniref:APC family permease n=1 Tax=Sedimentibacter sp. TaxID=1960295 RepID=UPI003158C35C
MAEMTSTGELSTKDLNRVLGRKDLMSIAVGQIIGAGIMSLTGVAIGMTGKSVPLSFMVAAIFKIIMAIPFIIIGGTVRMRGGQYTQVAILAGQKWSGIYMITYIFSNVALAMYAISFAQYAQSLIPGIPLMPVSIIMLTAFYILNIMGVQGAAVVQNAMVVLMASGLAIFVAFGFGHLQPGIFSGSDFMTNGVRGIMGAGALLGFAAGGAFVVINFGAEAKNPTKDIPFVIVVSTLAVSGVYAFMSIVAANVLPISEVAYQPLSLVAKAVMPNWAFVFFTVCGAGFALSTTLNATLAWVTKPVLQAVEDGWFPKFLGAINEKYKTPHVLLTIFYLIGLIPIITGLSIGTIANAALLIMQAFNIVLSIALTRLPKVLPEEYARSKVKVSTPVLYTIAYGAAACAAYQFYLLWGFSTNVEKIYVAVILVMAVLFGCVMNKKVKMTISYEAD